MIKSKDIAQYYDALFIKVYAVISELYKDVDRKVTYSVYTILIPIIALYVVPTILILEHIFDFEEDSYLPVILNAIVIIGLAILHFKRYSKKTINSLVQINRMTLSRQILWALNSLVLIISGALWTLAVLFL